MLRLSFDSVTSFSAAPLRLATWLGVVSFVACVALIVAGLIAHWNKVTVPGWTSLFVAVLLLGAVQLICLGLLGEYIGRIYAGGQNRPTYLVEYDTDDQTGATAVVTSGAKTKHEPDVATLAGRG